MSRDPQKAWKDIETAIQQHTLVDEDFRNELLADPKATLEKYLQTPLPVDLTIHVHETDFTNLHLAIPAKFTKEQLEALELSDEQLELVAGGEVAITTAVYSAITVISIAVTYTTNDQTRHRFGW